MEPSPETILRGLFATAVSAVSAACVMPGRLPEPPTGRVLVLGAGKAAAAMAAVVEDEWLDRLGPDRFTGVVTVPDGHGAPTRRIEVACASHPLPDVRGEAAARRALAEAGRLGPDDLLLALLSGGASALWAAPAAGLSLAAKRAITERLLVGGVPIDAMNAVRRRLSAIKGGRLALAAAPARVCNLIISDVPGDDPSVVGSGPTLPAQADLLMTRGDAIGDLAPLLPEHALALLLNADDQPFVGDPRLPHTETTLVAGAANALAAAQAQAERLGYEVVMLGDNVQGEARKVAMDDAGRALQFQLERSADAPPLLLLSGGETTVTVGGAGLGGRNTEYALALALALGGAPGIHALAADTDGVDGRGGHAGAIVGPDSLRRAAAAGLSGQERLAKNDSAGFFDCLHDLVVTGPTLTNVNDFRAIVIIPRKEP